MQLQIPRIEDGNNFGVAVQVRMLHHSSALMSLVHAVFHFLLAFFPQEKVFELMTALHTKLEGFHTQISK